VPKAIPAARPVCRIKYRKTDWQKNGRKNKPTQFAGWVGKKFDAVPYPRPGAGRQQQHITQAMETLNMWLA